MTSAALDRSEPPRPGKAPPIRWRGSLPTRESVRRFASWVRRLRVRAEWSCAAEDRARLEEGKRRLNRFENALKGAKGR